MSTFKIFFGILFFVSSFVFAQDTYTVGETEYYYNSYYSTTGEPKVKRSYSNKMEFLRSYGYSSVPDGYEVDHIIPLSQGGSDSPDNMQLLTVEQHKEKTASERAFTALTSSSSNSYSLPSYYSTSYSLPSVSSSTYSIPTYTMPSIPSYSLPSSSSSRIKVYQTGPRGGTYYINSNGNKTYVKR